MLYPPLLPVFYILADGLELLRISSGLEMLKFEFYYLLALITLENDLHPLLPFPFLQRGRRIICYILDIIYLEQILACSKDLANTSYQYRQSSSPIKLKGRDRVSLYKVCGRVLTFTTGSLTLMKSVFNWEMGLVCF